MTSDVNQTGAGKREADPQGAAHQLAAQPAADPAARRALDLALVHEALTRSMARLTSHAELPALLTTVLQEIIRASGAVSLAVFAYDPANDRLYNYAQILRGEVVDVNDPRLAVFSTPTPAKGNPAWEAMLKDQYFWVDYNNPDPRAGPQSTAWHRQNRHGYVVCIPMMNGSLPVGFLGLAFDSAEVVRPTELRLERSRVLAQQAALTLQLTRLTDESLASALAEERKRSEADRHAALLAERNRLAREIHDTLAQSFTGVMMQLRAAQTAMHSNIPLVESCLARAEALAREGLSDARRSVMALRPDAAEYSDLASKARWLIEKSTTGTPVGGKVIVSGVEQPIAADTGFQMFRIAQEAVANALRHAKPTTLCINLAYGQNHLSMSITDDGRGFSPEAARDAGGNGLLSMDYRVRQLNGTLDIQTHAAEGTTVHVQVPLNES